MGKEKYLSIFLEKIGREKWLLCLGKVYVWLKEEIGRFLAF
jgi:hypothetical protein